MTIDRRSFLSLSALFGAGLAATLDKTPVFAARKTGKNRVISTWKHGFAANEAAQKVINGGGSAVDAAEQGVRVSEGDPEVTGVGYGGYPDENGHVTLDACIMNSRGNAG